MAYSFEEISDEFSAGEHPHDLFVKHKDNFNTFLKDSKFSLFMNAELKESILKSDFNKFDYLVLIVQGHDYNSSSRPEHFVLMMDFIIKGLERNEMSMSAEKMEWLLTQVLDVLWHQSQGLEKLDSIQQKKLCSLLAIATKFEYEITENGNETFHAIKKGMDLIKYQDSFGDSEKLHSLFEHHFDSMIRERFVEHKKNNWL